MTGRSLVPLMVKAPPVDAARDRDHVLTGKERHVPGQEKPDLGGTPMRAIRTREFLYVRNFRPDRWPAGTPDAEKAVIAGRWLADCDNGPTKSYLVDHRNDPRVGRLWDLAFAKRPAEELYDLRKDPEQMENVADRPEYAQDKARLSERLMAESTRDGRPQGRWRRGEARGISLLRREPDEAGPRARGREAVPASLRASNGSACQGPGASRSARGSRWSGAGTSRFIRRQ